MVRALMYLFLGLFLALNMSACSIFGSDDEEQDTATVSEEKKEGDEYSYDDFEEGDSESADSEDESDDDSGEEDFDEEVGEEVLEVGAVEEGAEPVDIATEDSFADENAVDDYPDDDYSIGGGESEGAENVAALEPTPGEDEFSDGESLVADEGESDQVIPEEPLESNEDDDLFARDEEPAPAPEPEPEPQQSFADTSGLEGDDRFIDVPSFVPVKKMKAAAYTRAGSNINRLYVTRPGDDMGSIAGKIYGSDRSEDLYKWNSHFRGKDLKVGDKVYYSSPNNPNDQSMKTFYEDNNISPQYFTAQKDGNFRKVAQKLLGHERSWMEVYATNDSIDDKWSLPAGTQLRYWPDGAAATVAQASPPPPAPEPEPEPEPVAVSEPEPEEPAEVEEIAEVEEVEEIPEEVANIDEPSDMESDEDFAPPPAAGSVKPVPPPPPNPVAPPPPPPPPPPSPLANKLNNVKKSGGSSLGAQDDSMIMGALGGLLILAAIILLVFLRRGRSKRVNFSQTQV